MSPLAPRRGPQRRSLLGTLTVALLAGAIPARAEMTNNVEFQPVFNAASGLELRVQNYSKLPRTLSGVDVFVGGNADVAACHVAVPGITLPPAARNSVIVADAKTINGCLPATARPRGNVRLTALDNMPLRDGAADPAPVPLERSVRVVPRFGSGEGAATEPRQLRFRLPN